MVEMISAEVCLCLNDGETYLKRDIDFVVSPLKGDHIELPGSLISLPITRRSFWLFDDGETALTVHIEWNPDQTNIVHRTVCEMLKKYGWVEEE